MKPLIFEKNYTRDTTIMIQQIWAQALSRGLREKKGWVNPYLPMIVHFMRNGTIEIWDNTLAREWYMEKFLEENIRDESILLKSIAEYKEQLARIKTYWAKGIAETLAEFQEFLALMPDATFNFNMWYYAVINDKTPQHLLDIMLEIRKDDVFFSTTDIYISNTLKKLCPQIAGCESAVLLEEVAAIPTRAILEARLGGAALIDGFELFLGDHDTFSKKYPSYVLQSEKVAEGTTSVKGQIAFKGLVKGPVRILRRRDQVGEVQVGDIIVSPMTTPDFLPAMRAAAAFVTDEGGITCHAAIVARELNKPCVIGTKVATQVFKDGDMVEVDALSGVVRKI
ncbi:MAG: hypothetical protein RIT04_418 [Candidatus Parcubacteria bacterium]|jgi:phosphohistidine swiveling domain-containing protein